MSLRRMLTIALFLAPLAALTVKAADSTTMELMQTIPLKGKPGKLDHLTVDNKGERLLLANKVNNTLDIIDLKAGKLLKLRVRKDIIDEQAKGDDAKSDRPEKSEKHHHKSKG